MVGTPAGVALDRLRILGRNGSADRIQQSWPVQVSVVGIDPAGSNVDAIVRIRKLRIIHHRRSDCPGPLADDALGGLRPIVIQCREGIFSPIAGVVSIVRPRVLGKATHDRVVLVQVVVSTDVFLPPHQRRRQ